MQMVIVAFNGLQGFELVYSALISPDKLTYHAF